MKYLLSSRVPAVLCLCLIMALSLSLTGCSEDEHTHMMEPAEVGSVAFNFDNSVDGAPLVLGIGSGYPYTNSSGNQYAIESLFYYTCNFRVHMADGTSFGSDAVHYRDAGDPATRTFTLDGIPVGTYTAVSFTFGIDARRNHDGALLPDFDQIPWPGELGGGYHYMMMNGRWDNNGTDTRVAVHTGRRYITANPGPPNAVPPGPDAVPHHHYFEVYLTLASPINLADGQTWSVPLDLNINGWFTGPTFNFADWFVDDTMMSMIMPKLAAQDLLLQNGIAGSVCSAGTPTLQ